MFTVIDNGFDHEQKLKDKGLKCPPLSGFNHLAIFLRWAYSKGMIEDKVFEKEPLLKPALEGNGDVREVLANSAYLKGRIYLECFTEENREFVEWFYARGVDKYYDCVDRYAEKYYGHSVRVIMKDESYLFVPYDDEYYKGLSIYLDDALENSSPKARGISIGQDKLDDIIETVKRKTETDAVIISTDMSETDLFSSKVGGLPYWPKDKEYPVDSKGNKLLLLAQINLSDVNYSRLPGKGMLQFFVAADDVYGLDDEKGHKVIYHENIDSSITEQDVRAQGIIANTDLEDSYLFVTDSVFKLSFSVEKDFLVAQQDGYDKLVTDILNNKYGYRCDFPWRQLVKEDYAYLGKDEPVFFHKMFGYPLFTQSDPREYKEELQKYDTLLLQLDSECEEDKGEICIGDSGIINFFINSKDLENLNFDDVLYNWDCY